MMSTMSPASASSARSKIASHPATRTRERARAPSLMSMVSQGCARAQAISVQRSVWHGWRIKRMQKERACALRGLAQEQLGGALHSGRRPRTPAIRVNHPLPSARARPTRAAREARRGTHQGGTCPNVVRTFSAGRDGRTTVRRRCRRHSFRNLRAEQEGLTSRLQTSSEKLHFRVTQRTDRYSYVDRTRVDPGQLWDRSP